jgi:hypothetical protein
MSPSRSWHVGAAVLVVFLALGTTELAAAAGIPYGPGPRAHYTVQPQPPPGSCHYRFTSAHQPLPDPHCTPGALNPRVTQANAGFDNLQQRLHVIDPTT